MVVLETIRFAKHNKREAYKNLLSIVLGPPRWLTFLCKNDNGSIIYKAKLQNILRNIVKIAINVNCQRVAYSDGLVYGFGNSLVYFYAFEKKNSPNIDTKALSSKKNVTDALAILELPAERRVAGCQRKLLKHQENILKQYKRAIWSQNVIVFDNFQENVIEASAIVDSNLWYVACLSDRSMK